MKNFTLVVFFIFFIFFGCTKGPDFTPIPPPHPPTDSTVVPHCSDFSVEDSLWAWRHEDFIFDSAGRLIRHKIHIAADSSYDWQVIFTYENGNMVKSYMYLGPGNTTVPYTTSEYDYSGNVLTGSKYYLGNLLLVHSDYSFDSAGNLITYTQNTDNTTYQYDNSYTLNLHYDDHSNIVAVTDWHGDTVASYLNYDDHLNPYFKLPYDFAYDITNYFQGYFSKNNPQKLFNQFSPSITQINNVRYGFTYQYDNKGRIIKADQTGFFADSSINTLQLKYKCD